MSGGRRIAWRRRVWVWVVRGVAGSGVVRRMGICCLLPLRLRWDSIAVRCVGIRTRRVESCMLGVTWCLRGPRGGRGRVSGGRCDGIAVCLSGLGDRRRSMGFGMFCSTRLFSFSSLLRGVPQGTHGRVLLRRPCDMRMMARRIHWMSRCTRTRRLGYAVTCR